MAASESPTTQLRCVHCGERLVRSRRPGHPFTHVSRGVVAACDLDADHPAEPAPAPRPPRGAPAADSVR